MKAIRIVGVAGVVATVVLAVAAGPASATELCSTNTNPCSGTMYSGGKEVHAVLSTGRTSTFTSSLGNVVCTASTLQGVTLNTGGTGTPVETEVTAFTFAGCSLGSTKCEVKGGATGLPLAVEFLASGGLGNGTMTTGWGEAFLGTYVHCGSFMNCTFSLREVQLDVTGGNPAQLTAKEEQMTLASGELCPATIKWDASYEFLAPKPLFLVSP